MKAFARPWFGFVCAICALLPGFVASRLPAENTPAAAQPLTERDKIIHALNRIGFGPRPGDVEKVERLGLSNYIAAQLRPETIDDSACDRILAQFDTLNLDSSDLMKEHYAGIRRFIERQKESGNMEALKQYGIMPAAGMASPSATPAQPAAAASSPVPASGGKLAELAKDLPQHISVRCLGELQTAKVVRAVESERQLQEVLTDFWTNHFNIDTKKGDDRELKVVDDREVIRPHVFGKFRDLLEASAQSPAMLVYLDNAENSIPRQMSVMEQKIRAEYQQKLIGHVIAQPDDKPKMEGGLNENYGREIMELHTLGVDGGYTQKDVQEVARCFTGWGYNKLTGKFQFNPRRHDDGAKTVLGHAIPAGGGIKDGETVITILASHPATAKHIATELCERLVCDQPPPALVNRVAAVFQDTDGDLRQVVAAILTSPEFFSPANFRAKIKSPFEFAVSAVRAGGGHIQEGPFVKVRTAMEGAATIGFGTELVSGFKRKSLNWSIFQMGEPLFAYQAPTGYPEDSRKWVSTGALIARLNFALALTGGAMADVSIPTGKLLTGVDIDKPEEVLNRLVQELLQNKISDSTRETLRKTALTHEEGQSSTVNVPQLAALLLGSPEFQRR